MKFYGKALGTSIFWGGCVFMFLVLWAPVSFGEREEVKVISRTPDKSNPLYETDQVEGGVFFYVPKGTTFVKKYGVISPVNSLEFLVEENEGMKEEIESLNHRIAVLEGSAEAPSKKKEQ